MRLYDERSRRLYVNPPERVRFLTAAKDTDPPVRALCLTIFYTGCRLSEALALTTASIDPTSRIISFRTLKRRSRHEVREVPIPPVLAKRLATLAQQQLKGHDAEDPKPPLMWSHNGRPLNRITGYRWIKTVMQAADIQGPQASPKGLRHGFGVHALRSGVQLNMLRKWMGHSSMATTAIYANAMGSEEMEIARRMWR
ncbi:MAG: site-specific integrase [Gammaproteobacteria bacterium]|nr:site-specific integrase [Gammaproteobacteria bacterium]